jgi:hypothetical protein
MKSLRRTLQTGATVFGLSALLLVLLPSFFLELLGITSNVELDWAMRMIGITLVALAGQMFVVGRFLEDRYVKYSAQIMQISAAALAILTGLIPGGLTWFGWLYLLIGAGFSLAYSYFLLKVR